MPRDATQTREKIVKTASRLFSRFAREGLIRINQREVRLLDLPALKQLLGQENC